jgi:hypothetical protein
MSVVPKYSVLRGLHACLPLGRTKYLLCNQSNTSSDLVLHFLIISHAFNLHQRNGIKEQTFSL